MLMVTPQVKVRGKLVESPRDEVAMMIASTRPLAPEKRLRAPDLIARDLGRAILSGVYKPGHRFADEITFSKLLKVSRSVYRDAVRILADRGLVEPLPKIGTVVTARRNWNLLDPAVLSWTFGGEPDLTLLEGLFEHRSVVEPAAAAIAAIRRSEEQLSRLENALRLIERLTLKTEAGGRAEQEFHVAILHATANPYFASQGASIAAATDAVRRFWLRNSATAPVPDYGELFRAVQSRNPEKARADMEKLLTQTLLDISLS